MRFVKIVPAALAFVLCQTAVMAQTAPEIIGTDTLLRQESDLSQLPLLRNWTSNLQSSYDRTGGNGDSGNYLAPSGNTATILDVDGPGAMVRFWSADSTSHFGNISLAAPCSHSMLHSRSLPPAAIMLFGLAALVLSPKDK